MSLQMNLKLAENYTSRAQVARVLTENWLLKNGYCPSCGLSMTDVKNNAQVHDFTCELCFDQYELKSFLGKTPAKVNDGAYESMMKRIADIKSPHFFFLGYSSTYSVVNCFAVPNYLFQPSTIEKRKPLASTARRAGWTGCLIKLYQIPEIGKIKLVENGKFIQRDIVKKSWDKTKFLAENKSIKTRGWALDVLNCIEKLDVNFTLSDLYHFEQELSAKHPENKHIKDKIRQQLQVLRDKGFLEFTSRGVYRKTCYE
jgi:type II restriction enzyme